MLTPFLRTVLVILDGGKGLRAAVRKAFRRRAVVQRCQWHKRENVCDDSCNNAAADVYEGRRVAILTRRERIKRRTLLGSHSLLLREGVMPWTGGLERAE